MRVRLLLVMLCAAASSAAAQGSSDTLRLDERSGTSVWASLTVGPGYASNRQSLRIGGQLGLFGSYGPWLGAYRRGGASGIESGGAYDDALLVGRRWTRRGTTAYAAVGPAKVYDESSGLGDLGVGFSAEFGGNLTVVGLGITALGAASSKHRYVAVGLTLDAGWIR